MKRTILSLIGLAVGLIVGQAASPLIGPESTFTQGLKTNVNAGDWRTALGVTNGSINPTDGYLPYRSNSTTFADSPLRTTNSNSQVFGLGIAFDSTSLLLGQSTPTSFGFNSQYSLASSHVVSRGDNQLNTWHIESVSSPAWTNYAYADLGSQAFDNGPVAMDFLMTCGIASRSGSSFEVSLSSQAGPSYANGSWIKAMDGSSTRFYVDIPNSGYTGTGDLFLSDNGRYKSAGGGGGTNYWKLFSGSLTPQDQSLRVQAGKSFYLGEHSTLITNYTGDIPDSQLIIWNDLNEGDPDYFEMWMGAYEDSDHVGVVNIYGGTGAATLDLGGNWETNNVFMDIRMDPYSKIGKVVISGMFEGKSGPYYICEPLAVDGGTPYVFDTARRHTVGNLMEVKHLSTNRFVVTYEGALLLNPMTKDDKAAMTPVEGMLVFQSDNTPGLRIYQGGAWRMVSTVADP